MNMDISAERGNDCRTWFNNLSVTAPCTALTAEPVHGSANGLSVNDMEQSAVARIRF
jgi:hypothetical protein